MKGNLPALTSQVRITHSTCPNSRSNHSEAESETKTRNRGLLVGAEALSSSWFGTPCQQVGCVPALGYRLGGSSRHLQIPASGGHAAQHHFSLRTLECYLGKNLTFCLSWLHWGDLEGPDHVEKAEMCISPSLKLPFQQGRPCLPNKEMNKLTASIASCSIKKLAAQAVWRPDMCRSLFRVACKGKQKQIIIRSIGTY